jgi:hypothetical protein
MELPFNFVAKTTAKAAQVMANFNTLRNAVTAIETTLSTGVPKVAAGVINRAQMAAGYDHRLGIVNGPVAIAAGSQASAVITWAHGLGEGATSASGSVEIAENYAIAFDVHIIALDATNVSFQLMGSTPVPGAINVTVMMRVWS